MSKRGGRKSRFRAQTGFARRRVSRADGFRAPRSCTYPRRPTAPRAQRGARAQPARHAAPRLQQAKARGPSTSTPPALRVGGSGSLCGSAAPSRLPMGSAMGLPRLSSSPVWRFLVAARSRRFRCGGAIHHSQARSRLSVNVRERRQKAGDNLRRRRRHHHHHRRLLLLRRRRRTARPLWECWKGTGGAFGQRHKGLTRDGSRRTGP